MIVVNDNTNENGVVVTQLIEYDEESIQKAIRVFEKYKEKGVIRSEFSDDEWLLVNSLERVHLEFDFDEILYIRESKSRAMYTFQQFVNSVKSFVVLTMSDTTIEGMRNNLLALKKFIKNTKFFNPSFSEQRLKNIGDALYILVQVNFLEKFLNYIMFEGTSQYIDLLEEDLKVLREITVRKEKESTLNRRSLVDLQSIFLFDKLLNEFWSNESDINKKALYYPLFIWWKIANIIPIRVKEFLLTSYNCIIPKDNGLYEINLRRSLIKGGNSSKKITHTLDDFEEFSYPVSSEIVRLIDEYKELSKPYRKDNILLFCHNTYIHYASVGMLAGFKLSLRQRLENEDIKFKPEALRCTVHRFYKDIILKEKGMKLIGHEQIHKSKNGHLFHVVEGEKDDFEPLKPNEISIISLGDIRHFAMINMVLNDISPTLVRDIVRHKDINTSYHYFGNIDEVVKCLSYLKYKELCKYNPKDVIKEKQLNITANKIINAIELEDKKVIEMDNGYCSSVNFANGNLKDCIVVDGECEMCDYHTKTKCLTKEQRKARLDAFQKNVRKEGELLGELLASHKEGCMPSKELLQSKLRLQNAAAVYMQDVKKNGWCEDEG